MNMEVHKIAEHLLNFQVLLNQATHGYLPKNTEQINTEPFIKSFPTVNNLFGLCLGLQQEIFIVATAMSYCIQDTKAKKYLKMVKADEVESFGNDYLSESLKPFLNDKQIPNKFVGELQALSELMDYVMETINKGVELSEEDLKKKKFKNMILS